MLGDGPISMPINPLPLCQVGLTMIGQEKMVNMIMVK